MFIVRTVSQGTGGLISGLGQQTTKGEFFVCGGRSITVKSNCSLQRNLISPSYPALGGNAPHAAARKIEATKTSITFPSVKERAMAFQAVAQKHSNTQERNTLSKELSVVKQSSSLNHSGVLNHDPVLSVSSKTIPHQDKKGVMVFLGKEGVGEQALNILGQQIPRTLKGKEPYDILFISQSTKADYEKKAQQYVIDSLSDADLKSKDVNVAIGAAVKTAYKNNRLLTPEEFNVDSYKKVYILGHGSAGDNHITCGSEYLGHREIISRMESVGLLGMRDIRLLPCYSADAQKITSTSPFRSNAEGGMSLLEYTANELTDRGYTDIKVVAYNGAGVFVSPDKKVPLTHLRALPHNGREIVLPRSERKVSVKTG
ncbi:hypothetical protein [Escherichia coli]|uniref:hypothetical protein n=2 Tax=Escherichia coli TaxID=562 RepID=UPI0003A5A26F|nr:hypothetical protein [Escherichia coli]EHW5945965.1 hypothetical protein [Escherichia coli]EIC3806174.1 hypothetical protein [Escherichia coli]EJU0900018.1 hypothetical protein [Escherichia coli]MCJ8425712.1 hypothetical protein [Escherichia coli]MCJ8435379.1 hypothetical protein [Escherichia coli]